MRGGKRTAAARTRPASTPRAGVRCSVRARLGGAKSMRTRLHARLPVSGQRAPPADSRPCASQQRARHAAAPHAPAAGTGPHSCRRPGAARPGAALRARRALPARRRRRLAARWRRAPRRSAPPSRHAERQHAVVHQAVPGAGREQRGASGSSRRRIAARFRPAPAGARLRPASRRRSSARGSAAARKGARRIPVGGDLPCGGGFAIQVLEAQRGGRFEVGHARRCPAAASPATGAPGRRPAPRCAGQRAPAAIAQQRAQAVGQPAARRRRASNGCSASDGGALAAPAAGFHQRDAVRSKRRCAVPVRSAYACKVTRLISDSVVAPRRTRSSAARRRLRVPLAWAAALIWRIGRLSTISSRISSFRVRISAIERRPL